MKRSRKILGLLLVAIVSFVGFCALFLWQTGYFSRQGPRQTVAGKSNEATTTDPKKNIATTPTQLATFSLPAPFSFEEISRLAQSLQENKREYEKKLKELEKEREEVIRIRADIEERKQEVESLMEKVTTLMAEWDEKKRLWKAEKVQVAVGEEQNLKKLAKLFAGMDAEQAAERIGQMEIATGAKILSLMAPRAASKVLSQIDVEKVKTLTQLMKKAEAKSEELDSPGAVKQ